MIKMMKKPLGKKEFEEVECVFENQENAKLIFDRFLTFGFQVMKAKTYYIDLELMGSQVRFLADTSGEITEMVVMATLWQDAYEGFQQIILDEVIDQLQFLPQKNDAALFNLTLAKIQMKVALMIAKKITKPKHVSAGIRLKKEDLVAVLEICEKDGLDFERALELAT